MFSTAYLPLFLLPISALQIPSILAPFYEPHLDDSLLLSNESLIPTEHDLLKRDGNCPTGFNSCSTFAAADAGACCTQGSFCTTDHAKNIACCPVGATCTGTIGRATAATTTTTTSTGGAVFGSSTTTPTTTTTTTSGAASTTTGSYVSNPYFPFPYIATSYIDSSACNTAYLACQTNYAACTADLNGGNAGFGVTIVAPAGGITVAPTVQTLGLSSATSICNSLSYEACYGIVSANCAQFGTGTGGSFVMSPTTNAVARQTVGCFAAAGIIAGMGLGIAGQIV